MEARILPLFIRKFMPMYTKFHSDAKLILFIFKWLIFIYVEIYGP